jgi:predicted DNA-binding transcriptional regulator YafY
VSTKERRKEIVRLLRIKRRTTIPYLARYFEVNVRTIQRDLVVLSAEDHIPIITYQGNGGGVMIDDDFDRHRNIFSREQNKVLAEILGFLDEYQHEVILEMLHAFGKPPEKEEST